MWLRDRFKPILLAGLLAAPGAALISILAGSAADRADFTFVNQCEITSLDPAVATAIPEGRIIAAVFEGLATVDPVSLAPRPGAAQSWEMSADGLVYTFHLRPDSRWSDGSPLTAADFLYSWTRFLKIAPYAYLLWPVAGAKAFHEERLPPGEALGLEAPDDRTFIVRLDAPCPYFLNIAAFYVLCPVKRDCVEGGHGADWTRPEHFVGNGPFRIRERRLKDRIRLERNPFYWDGESVALATIDALAVDSPMTALNLYLTGAVDWINVVPPIALPALRGRRDFSATPNLGTNFLRFNTGRRPLGDPAVRRALQLAVDSRELVEGVLKGGQAPAASFVPPGIPGYDPPAAAAFDPLRARELLAGAGFPEGRGFPELDLLYSTGETARDICEVLAIQLRRHLGIRVHPASQERKVYNLSQETLDYDIALCSWLGDYLDPSTFLDVFASESGNNRTGWSEPRYDALLRAAAVEMDPVRRAELLGSAETILMHEAPIAVLYFRTTTNMIAPVWEGYADNILDVHPLKHLRRRGR